MRIINNIESKNLNKIKSFFTENGWKDANSLINYGNAKLISKDLELDVVKVNHNYVVRKVPMYFKFKSYNKEFVEDLVFYFTEDLKVSGLSFSISDIAINDIKNKKAEWGTTQDKYQLINFIENYKTAYCLKDLDYIEKVFDDNALIIVGRSLKNAPVNENRDVIHLFNNDQVEYIRKTKENYIKSLSMVFRSNEYINIHFEDNEIRKTNKDDKIYGIQIAQYYTSTNYSDKGYHTLLKRE